MTLPILTCDLGLPKPSPSSVESTAEAATVCLVHPFFRGFRPPWILMGDLTKAIDFLIVQVSLEALFLHLLSFRFVLSFLCFYIICKIEFSRTFCKFSQVSENSPSDISQFACKVFQTQMNPGALTPEPESDCFEFRRKKGKAVCG